MSEAPPRGGWLVWYTSVIWITVAATIASHQGQRFRYDTMWGMMEMIRKFVGLLLFAGLLCAITLAPSVRPALAGTPASAASPAQHDRRIALVIGNSAYRNVPPLHNPENDANLVGDALRRTGFETVMVRTDLRREALIAALRDFAVQAESADWAVVYYAGHGLQAGGINYLIPTDAKLETDRDIDFEAVALEQVLNAAEGARKLRLVILDASRDNPFADQTKRTRSMARGLAAVRPQVATLVVFAGRDGEATLDGDGNNSPFAQAFVKNLQMPGLEVRRLFDYVRDDVMEATAGRQQPYTYGSLPGREDFFFVEK